MSDQSAPAAHVSPAAKLSIETISYDAPWSWLAAGWRDMLKVPSLSLGYGVLFTILSFGLAGILLSLELFSLVIAFGGGFMLIGPLLAMGLYEASRRLEAGKNVTLGEVLIVKTAAPSQIAFVGVVLMLMLLAWIRIATLLFALFFGVQGGYPPLVDFLPTLLFTQEGVAMLAIGTLVGGAIAVAVFSVAAVSLPLMLERDIDAVSAMALSVQAVRKNPGPMLLWAWLILIVMAFGLLTAFIGMIISFPLLGHATWHAYRGLVIDAQD